MKTEKVIQSRLEEIQDWIEILYERRKKIKGYVPDSLENQIDRAHKRISELEWVLDIE